MCQREWRLPSCRMLTARSGTIGVACAGFWDRAYVRAEGARVHCGIQALRELLLRLARPRKARPRNLQDLRHAWGACPANSASRSASSRTETSASSGTPRSCQLSQLRNRKRWSGRVAGPGGMEPRRRHLQEAGEKKKWEKVRAASAGYRSKNRKPGRQLVVEA